MERRLSIQLRATHRDRAHQHQSTMLRLSQRKGYSRSNLDSSRSDLSSEILPRIQSSEETLELRATARVIYGLDRVSTPRTLESEERDNLDCEETYLILVKFAIESLETSPQNCASCGTSTILSVTTVDSTIRGRTTHLNAKYTSLSFKRFHRIRQSKDRR